MLCFYRCKNEWMNEFSLKATHENTVSYWTNVTNLNQKSSEICHWPRIICVLEASVSVCRAPITTLMRRGFRDSKLPAVTSSPLNCPSNNTWTQTAEVIIGCSYLSCEVQAGLLRCVTGWTEYYPWLDRGKLQREGQQGQQDEDGGSSQIHQTHKPLKPQQLSGRETQTDRKKRESINRRFAPNFGLVCDAGLFSGTYKDSCQVFRSFVSPWFARSHHAFIFSTLTTVMHLMPVSIWAPFTDSN